MGSRPRARARWAACGALAWAPGPRPSGQWWPNVTGSSWPQAPVQPGGCSPSSAAPSDLVASLGCALESGSEAAPRSYGMFGPGHVSGRHPLAAAEPPCLHSCRQEAPPCSPPWPRSALRVARREPTLPWPQWREMQVPTEQPCEGVRFAVDTTTAVQALTTRSNPAHLSSSDSQPGPPVREGELGFVAGLPWEHFPPGAVDRRRVGAQPGRPGKRRLVRGRLPGVYRGFCHHSGKWSQQTINAAEKAAGYTCRSPEEGVRCPAQGTRGGTIVGQGARVWGAWVRAPNGVSQEEVGEAAEQPGAWLA